MIINTETKQDSNLAKTSRLKVEGNHTVILMRRDSDCTKLIMENHKNGTCAIIKSILDI